jgi:hypothetical protein
MGGEGAPTDTLPSSSAPSACLHAWRSWVKKIAGWKAVPDYPGQHPSTMAGQLAGLGAVVAALSAWGGGGVGGPNLKSLQRQCG